MTLAHVESGRVGFELIYPLTEALMEPKHNQMLPAVDIRTKIPVVHIHIQRANSFFFFYIDSVHMIEDVGSILLVYILDRIFPHRTNLGGPASDERLFVSRQRAEQPRHLFPNPSHVSPPHPTARHEHS